jgi:hypothetical protein
MGATHFGTVVLVGVSASIVGRSVAALGALLVNDNDGTGNDGGLLLRSQDHWAARRTGRSGLRALLCRLNFRSFNLSRSVRLCNIEGSVCKEVDNIFVRITRCSKITRSGSKVSCHLLGWFDAMGRGWVHLGVR